MRPLAVYSAMRLGLFVVLLLVLLAVGARGLLAVALAAVTSLALSYVLLRRQRDSVARALLARRDTPRNERFSDFLRKDADAEDAAADAARTADAARAAAAAARPSTDGRDRP